MERTDFMNQRTKLIVKSLDTSTEFKGSEEIIQKVIKTVIKNGGRQIRNNVYEIGDITPIIRRFNSLKFR